MEHCLGQRASHYPQCGRSKLPTGLPGQGYPLNFELAIPRKHQSRLQLQSSVKVCISPLPTPHSQLSVGETKNMTVSRERGRVLEITREEERN